MGFFNLDPPQAIGDIANTNVSGIPELRSFAVASVPDASKPGRLIFVTDETGGPVPAYSDGTNWRRFSDGAIIS